jgi:hypothetical protein
MKQSAASFIFALWAISGFFSPLYAQAPAKFPESPNEFVAKLGEFMTQNKRPDMEESYAVFNKMYKSGIFSDTDIKRIIRLSPITKIILMPLQVPNRIPIRPCSPGGMYSPNP